MKTERDQAKLEVNLAKRNLDFPDARLRCDECPQYSILSQRGGEARSVCALIQTAVLVTTVVVPGSKPGECEADQNQ
jgi:hypothetical protein